MAGNAPLAHAHAMDAQPVTRTAIPASSDKAIKALAAIEAVRRRDPGIDVAANKARLVGTLGLEMAHPDGERLGLGDVDDARLDRAIDLISAVKSLPARPHSREVFDRRFLPPVSQQVRIQPGRF
jgi:NitT/TauT family transport system substrate-binding protein